VALGVAGSSPVSHPNYPIPLHCNELQLVLDGEYLSRTFYLAMSLGDGAIINFCICAYFANILL
jgi:hypothetical protein